MTASFLSAPRGLLLILMLVAFTWSAWSCGDDSSFQEVTEGELTVLVANDGGRNFLQFPLTSPGRSNDSDTIAISNSGKGALKITQLITDFDDTGFITAKTTLPTLPLVLEPSISQQLSFRLSVPSRQEDDRPLNCPEAPAGTSTDQGIYCGSLTIVSDAREDATRVIQFFVQQSNGDIKVTPNVLTYDSPRQGQAQQQTITITNESTSGNLELKNITKTEFTGDSDQFSIDGFPFPQSLQPGESIDYDITFTPSSTDSITGKLQIESDDPTAPRVDVTIRTGEGRSAQIEVNPTQLVFPGAAPGTPQTQDVTVTNTGNGGALLINQILLRPSTAQEAYTIFWDDPATAAEEFVPWQNANPATIAASNSRVFRVEYEPTEDGVSVSGTMRFTSNGTNVPGGEVEVVLSGSSSEPNGGIAPSNMIFNVSPGESETRGFSVSNTGLAPLQIAGFSFTGNLDGEEFSVNPDPAGMQVGPGEIAAFDVIYTRQNNDVGLDQGTININTNNPFGNGDLVLTIQNNNQENAFSPVANIVPSPAGNVTVGTPITLDGAGSTAESGTITYYIWTLLERPATSTASIENPNNVSATLTPDAPGNYRVQLTVGTSNSLEGSAIQNITVTE